MRQGAAVEGAELAHHRAVADFKQSFLAAEFKVLRQRGHHRALVNGALFADAGAFGDVNLGSDVGAVVNDHIPFHNGVRADHHVRADLCLRIHQSRWMYLRHKTLTVKKSAAPPVESAAPIYTRSTMAAISSASQTSSLSTSARPIILHMVRRLAASSTSKRMVSPGVTVLRNRTLSMPVK
ncbi:MAG: hypothetical protein BWY83_02732 [bacterium ADurb.Bin478]|nr:MAG: hypothetical protein BWY83_02732 [bacterium ADurb.Bin478]